MVMDYDGFKKEVFAMSGIDLNAYKEKQMKRRLNSLISRNNFEGYDSYIRGLKENKALYNEFINFMTINVSEFYRNPDQWEKVRSIIFPLLLQKNERLKIWSAACSSGDEPYTLAMILNEFMPLNQISILATDIDKDVLEKARKGIYNKKSVEHLPSSYLNKYFTEVEDKVIIKDEIKRCIDFKYHNLLADKYPQNCDMIVCRNVLIYFTEEAKNQIYINFSKALKKEGILFVGSTEQILLYANYKFKPIQTFFYQKEEDA
ncbi:UNVERIFIED_CONTAM: chemotaxis protein methyltransferase CheR [Acetivibrio alkalicellulosi]